MPPHESKPLASDLIVLQLWRLLTVREAPEMLKNIPEAARKLPGLLARTRESIGILRQRTVALGLKSEGRFSPARVGETLRVAPQVTSRVVKEGRSGQLTFVEITATYTREDGTVVLVERSNTVERS